MSKKLTFASIFPEDLNLNGDQANLLVLAERLSWQGIQVEILPVTTEKIPDADLIFVGHGSFASWRSISDECPELRKNIVKLIEADEKVLAISSGAIWLADGLGISYQGTEHRSEFLSVDGIVGYLNSAVDLKAIVKHRKSILNMLHGPVLAKNPAFADQICIEAGWISQPPTGELKDEIDLLARQSRKTAFEH